MLKKIIFILFTAQCFLLQAQSDFHQERILTLRLEFKFDKKDETAQRLLKITRFCQQQLNAQFSKVNINTPILHILLEGPPPSKDIFNLIYFKRSELENLNAYSILEKIVTKMIGRTLVGLGGERNQRPPDWFVAATVFRLRLSNILSTEEKYPATRYAIVNYKFPKIDTLLDEKGANPKNFWLYRIYAEHCAVFLAAMHNLSQYKKKLLLILTEYKGESSVALLAKHFPSLNSTRLRQRWFNSSCLRVCFHVINPYPPEVIAQKISEVFSISSARPGVNGTNRIPLEKIFADEEEELNFAVISFIEKSFYEILLTCPPTLKPSLSLFFKALNQLKENEREDFVETIILARKQFNNAVTYQKRIISYANTLEQNRQNIHSDYRGILRTYDISQKRFKQAFPKFVNYLDALEEKLDNTVIQ
jgi:hypothetical protein